MNKKVPQQPYQIEREREYYNNTEFIITWVTTGLSALLIKKKTGLSAC